MPISVSVIINNFNYASFVADAIRSVLGQSYGLCQCIVVDDGSTDESVDVIRMFPVIDVVLKRNGGQTSAIRAGLERATGDIVIILDADDQLVAHAVERVVQAWSPETAVLLFALEKRDLQRLPVGRYPEKPFLAGNHSRYCLRWGEFPASPMSGNAFDSQVLRQLLSQIDDRTMPRPDGFLIYGASFFGKVTTLDEELGYYLIHGNNASTSAGRSYRRRHSQLLVDISHRLGLAELIRSRRIADISYKQILSPHHWREIALIRKYSPNEPSLRIFRSGDSLFYGVITYATFPGLLMSTRLKNIALLLVLPLLPMKLLSSTFQASWNQRE